MAIKVKPIGEAAEKLVSRAQAASGEYALAAAASGELWASSTIAAKDNFGQAITAAGIKERFARGVAKAGSQGYTLGITQKGRDRFSTGVSIGKSKYIANAEPFLSAIASLTLSPRQPRGSPANFQRVNQVGTALNAKRLAMLGAGAS